jgi:hypothetical protein
MQYNWDQDLLLLDRLIDQLKRQQRQLEDMLSKAGARADKGRGGYQPQRKHPLLRLPRRRDGGKEVGT